MKRITILLLSTVLSLGLFGQESGDKKDSRMEKLTERLDLSDEQVAEVELIFKEIKKEKTVIKQNELLTVEERKKQLKSLKLESEEKLSKVLSQEQMAEFKEMKAERQEHKKKYREERKNEFKEELGLSEKQTMAMKTIKEKAKHERIAIQENSNLSEEEKKARLKEVRKKSDMRIKEVLTEEQYAKMKSLKAEKRKERKHK